jgi:hypothetical protein
MFSAPNPTETNMAPKDLETGVFRVPRNVVHLDRGGSGWTAGPVELGRIFQSQLCGAAVHEKLLHRGEPS